MEVAKMQSLLAQLLAIMVCWRALWSEAKLVASSLHIEEELLRQRSTTARKRTIFNDEDTPDENVNKINEADVSTEEAHVRKNIFYVVWDDVNGWRAGRFNAVKYISDTYSFPLKYQWSSKEKLKRKTATLSEKYSVDICNEDLILLTYLFLSSSKRTVWKQPGCTRDQKIGTSLIMF